MEHQIEDGLCRDIRPDDRSYGILNCLVHRKPSNFGKLTVIIIFPFFLFDITTSILMAIIVIILTIFATLIIVIAINPEVWVHAFTCARRARLAIRFDGVARLRVQDLGFRV